MTTPIMQQLQTLLSGATNAGARVAPLTGQANWAKPYIVLQRVSFNSENVMSGSTGLANTRVQIDAYGSTYPEVAALAAQIDALMSGWSVQNISGIAQDFYESDVQLFRVALDYSIWHPYP
jgi:hypothetical protein